MKTKSKAYANRLRPDSKQTKYFLYIRNDCILAITTDATKLKNYLRNMVAVSDQSCFE